MRVLTDPDTGDLVEVVPEVCLGLVPYDYREAKAAAMHASLERRETNRRYKEAVRAKGAAERAYRSLKAQAVLSAKAEHGATVASDVANGREDVAAAKEAAIIAEGMLYSELEALRLCTEDRKSLVQLTAWSRAIAMADGGSFE